MKDNTNYLFKSDVVQAYPDGWTCVNCGTEFSKKTIDVENLYVISTDDGTECIQCNIERINENESEQRKKTIVDWTVHITWNNGEKEFRADTPYSKVIEEWLDNVQEEEAERTKNEDN